MRPMYKPMRPMYKQYCKNYTCPVGGTKATAKEREIKSVDYAFMHGSFKYQMPKFLRNKLDCL